MARRRQTTAPISVARESRVLQVGYAQTAWLVDESGCLGRYEDGRNSQRPQPLTTSQ